MADVPTILVVDENDDSRVELRRLLTRGGLSVAGEARYGASAAAAANELRPDAIVVGIEEPPNRALETIETLAQLLLDTPIIAYSSITEPGAIRRATRAGVRDYLMRPLDAISVHDAVVEVLAQERQRQRRRAGSVAPAVHGSVVTVTGAKGGVGKSVVAINLALSLRQVTGRTVALVDCDTHFGDVAMMLNLPTEPSITSTIAMAGELDRASVIERTVEHPSGIRILPGPSDPEDWEQINPADVACFLDTLAEAFDFVVIDTPDVFDRVVEQCVQCSTLVLLVTSMEITSIANTRLALRMLKRWETPPEKVLLAANTTRQHSGLGEKDISQALNWPVFWIIPYEGRVPLAGQMGDSLILTAPKAAFTRTFRELAGAISGAGRGEVKYERPTVLRRLLGRGPEAALEE